MNRRCFMYRSGLAVLATLTQLKPAASASGIVPAELRAVLEKTLRDHQLPGLAAAVVQGDRIVAQAAAGVRKLGGDDRINVEDRFMIGSCTKRMTATVACRLIDSGKLSFETTLEDALPGLEMRDDYRDVTIAQLLTFTGGIQPYTRVNPMLTPIMFGLKGTEAEQREQFIQHVLQEQPVVKPGTERRYSNASYALVAFISERISKRAFEELLSEEVFKPLAMSSAGFGPPRTNEHPGEPWLHRKGENGYVPESEDGRPGPSGVMSGAGGVHCCIGDLARFAAYEIAAAQGKDPLLSAMTSKRWQDLAGRGGGKSRSVFGGSPWASAGYHFQPDDGSAIAVAINGGLAREAVIAVFEGAGFAE